MFSHMFPYFPYIFLCLPYIFPYFPYIFLCLPYIFPMCPMTMELPSFSQASVRVDSQAARAGLAGVPCGHRSHLEDADGLDDSFLYPLLLVEIAE